jgi:hypothetical protein
MCLLPLIAKRERERESETRVESLLFLFYLDLFPTAAAGAARL